MEGKRNTLFDSLKGIGMLGILAIHFNAWYTIIGSNHPYLFTLINRADLGVEITFIINAILLSYSYEKHCINNNLTVISFIFSQFNKIIFIYWFSLIIKLILDYVKGNVTYSLGNIVSHFFFVNAFKRDWFNTFYGGSGYIGVIAVMWVVFPIILKFFRDKRKAIVVFAVSFMISYSIFSFVQYFYYPDDKAEWIVECFYFLRAIVSYALGLLLSFIIKDKETLLGRRAVWGITIPSIVFLITMMLNTRYSFFGAVLLIGIIIYANSNEAIWLIDNRFFALIGRHTFSIFLGHILLQAVLQNLDCSRAIKLLLNIILIIPLVFVYEVVVDKTMQKLLNAAACKRKGKAF